MADSLTGATPAPQPSAAGQDGQDGQTAALVINCEPLLTRIVEMVGRDGVVYRLRDDVPTDRLLWAFKLLDISQAVKDAATWDAREAALDDRDRERLNVVFTIVRHSYPQMSRDVVSQAFTSAQMEALLGYFFTSRLLPLLEQHVASAMQAAQHAEQAASQTEEQQAEQQATQPAEQATPRTATAGATRSRKR